MSWFEFPHTRTYDSDLGWLIQTMKQVLENVTEQDNKIAAVEQLAADLKEFVNNYFDNLDVQAEINSKIDQMAADGSLLALIETPAADAAAAWLAENLTPTSPPVDKTLTISNAAADAKTAGDFLRAVQYALDEVSLREVDAGFTADLSAASRVNGYAWRIGDSPVAGDEFYYLRYNVGAVRALRVTGRGWGDKYPLIVFYDANDQFISYEGGSSESYTRMTVPVPANAAYFYVNGATWWEASVQQYSGTIAYDVLPKSIANVVNAVNDSPELADADAAEVNTIYRIYFRGYLDEVKMQNLPISRFKSTMAILVTLGKYENAFRMQILFTTRDGVYMRFSGSNGYAAWEMCANLSTGNSITINPTDDVIGKFVEAANDDNVTDVYINSGEYDVIALYQKHYGSGFFDSYTGYSSGGEGMGAGIALKGGKRYHFSDQALFKGSYSGSNTAVTTWFSLFAGYYGKGFIADGLHITEASGLRYAVHVDFQDGTSAQNAGPSVLKNCYIETAVRCVGAGLMNGSVLELINSVFIDPNATDVVFCHTPNTQGEAGKLIINGCYSSNRFQIGKGGSNTAKSMAIVTNCSFKLLVNQPDNAFDLLAYNNTTHN